MIFRNLFRGDLLAEMYFEEDQIRLAARLDYSDHLDDSYANIFDSKLNKKMLNYISNDALGYYTFSASTEGMLEEYPSIYKDILTSYDTTRSEQYDLLFELFSIIIDEEEIGELMTGDAAFVLNDLAYKEVPYYTYEYDENYNSTRIEKTRMELVPMMTAMMGCENEVFISKLIKAGLKTEIITVEGAYYKFIDKHNEFPFDVYFAYQDDFFFSSNSKQIIGEISAGGVRNKIGGDQKKIITKNSGAIYADIEQIIKRAVESGMSEGSRDMKLLAEIQNDLKKLYAHFAYVKGDAVMNANITIPESSKNSATFLLHFIDKVIEFEKSNRYNYEEKSESTCEEGSCDEGSCEGGTEEQACEEGACEEGSCESGECEGGR